MTKIEKIRVLLQLTNALQDAEAMIYKQVDYLFPADDPLMVDRRNQVLEQIEEAIETFFEDQAKIYNKIMSDAAVDASIAFYTSPEGMEIIQVMPKINDEISEVGKAFAKNMILNILTTDDREDDDFLE